MHKRLDGELSLWGCGVVLLLASCTQMPQALNQSARSGKEIYQDCLLCHSDQELQRGPVLAGQDSAYLLRQLQKFKQGLRGRNPAHRQEMLMGSASDALDEEELAPVAGYIASLPPVAYEPSIRGDTQEGEKIYRARCLSCHGTQAEGTRSFRTGSLAVAEDWYVLAQLRHFKNGRRGIHPEDAEGRLMAQQLAGLDDHAFRNVVTYISRQFGHLRPARESSVE